MVVKEIDAETLKKRLDANEDIELIDIRSDAEVAQGVLPKSDYLPMHMIPLRMADFPKDKDIILYCRSGARSFHACSYLMQQGITNCINLQGGIISWARSGYEIVQRDPMARQMGA